MQWSTFDENFEQLEYWVAKSAKQLKHEDSEPKITLQEKKAALQHYRVLVNNEVVEYCGIPLKGKLLLGLCLIFL
ncbi:hypothetical protein DPMN_186643 [Dreissena polymorpha]|uniref:Uncharacterized protein n=1 Tax=Dreissena polymorpha TaxID=45954 RepID=A0A9D4I8C7_DREPO|nr:hypothetical protein DPMN_186643 [Dreissena polymorpha]